jgi:nickel/cobalt transporter (NicO) family protein
MKAARGMDRGPGPRDEAGPSWRLRLARAIALAGFLLSIVPAVAFAHPLGNFTINHYAGIRVGRDAVLLDFVLDRAEIPTFQEVRRLDPNGDGTIDPGEAAALRGPECIAQAPFLDLRVGASRPALELIAAGLTFPPGAGGLPTMRLVCTFRVPLPTPLPAATTLSFEDASFPERIGWREITVVGDGTTIGAAGGAAVPPTASVSSRLSAYPTDLLATPLDMRSASVAVTPGGPALAPLAVLDATQLPGASAGGVTAAVSDGLPATEADPIPAAAARVPAATAAVPGGVGTEIAGLLEARDLTPLAFVLSLLTAALLGAGHALTPGHGKTVMAAYLVGSRGTARHAVGLGLSVTVSHTFGILVLAGIVLGAGSALPPEAFNRWAPLASALLVLGIGGWLVAGQLRARRARRAAVTAPMHEHAHDHAHDDAHDDAHEHADELDGTTPGEHAHGGARHRRLTAEGSRITWRSLALLGLAGGIVPSTNALLLLLAAIASGRPAWGLVLVIAFGVGMAAVLGGVGLALVHARGLAARSGSGRVGIRIGRLVAVAPAVGAAAVLALGLWLTSQALAGSIVL